MRNLTHRPAQSLCIFCAFRTTANFFTTSAAPQRSVQPKERRQEDGIPPRKGIYQKRIEISGKEGIEFRATTGHKRLELGGTSGRNEFNFNRKRQKFELDKGNPLLQQHKKRSLAKKSAEKNINDLLDSLGSHTDGGHASQRTLRLGEQTMSRRKKQLSNAKIEQSLEKFRRTCTEDKVLARLGFDDNEMRSRADEFVDDFRDELENEGKSNPLAARLHDAAARGSIKELDWDIRRAFFSELIMSRYTDQDLQQQARQANLQYPSEWFPATRGRERDIHLHVGPTNSGKTYHALKRLEQAQKGVYAGPLRLLAHEVFMRLNAAQKRCNLVTGDERKAADDDPVSPMTSCTVEMVPLNAHLDVAVIDEIQIIGTEDRGWAWTQAFLGVQADEVHLCGEERAIPIIKELTALCGEKLTIHRYERLSPLKMSGKSLEGNIRNLQKGDCVVCFSVAAIHGLRQLVERLHTCKVAVIYGSLPPETRAQQARLFNDPDNEYDILIASDAVGMGLNLSIKRMVFQTGHKFFNGVMREMQVHEVKQIAGRAGRYSTAESDMKKLPAKDEAASLTEAPVVDNAPEPTSPAPTPEKQVGYVTTLERLDFPTISRAMRSEPMPITSAGILPPSYVIDRFVKYFPMGTPFSFVLERLHEISTTNSRFHLCDLKAQTAIADAIEEVEELTVDDRMIFCSSPTSVKKLGEDELILAYAKKVAEGKGVTVLDMNMLQLHLLDDEFTPSRAYLLDLERLHKGLVIWMWLCYRFPAIFVERELAMHVKQLTEARIEETLAKLSFDFQQIRKVREKAIAELLRDEQEVGEGGERTSVDAEEQDQHTSPEDAFAARKKLMQDMDDASEDVPVDHAELSWHSDQQEGKDTPHSSPVASSPLLSQVMERVDDAEPPKNEDQAVG